MKWLLDNWPAILAVLAAAPTLITALSKAPKSGGALAWVQWALGILSLLKHQSLSLPGLPAAPAPNKAEKEVAS